MILSTKKLFSKLRHSPKRKYKIYHKSKLSAPIISINENKNEINIMQNPIINTISHEENPFLKSQINQIKNSKTLCSKRFSKKTNSKKFKANHSKIYSLKNEFNSNKIKNNVGIRNRKESQDDIELLYKYFRESNLKSAFIIDINGNNNLDEEKKKLFKDYFNKKGSNSLNQKKINLSPAKKSEYSYNKFTRRSPSIKTNRTYKKKFSKFNNFNGNLNCLKKYNDDENIIKLEECNIDNKNFEDSFEIKDENKKEINDEDDNSIFENDIYKSNYSSFIGSFLYDDFYQILFNSKGKI